MYIRCKGLNKSSGFKCHARVHTDENHAVHQKKTSTSCKGIYLNHPIDPDAYKTSHTTCSAEPSGNQRTVAVSAELPAD